MGECAGDVCMPGAAVSDDASKHCAVLMKLCFQIDGWTAGSEDTATTRVFDFPRAGRIAGTDSVGVISSICLFGIDKDIHDGTYTHTHA